MCGAVNDLTLPWRWSKQKEDSRKAAEMLKTHCKPSFLSAEEISDLVRAGVRSRELKLRQDGRTNYIINLDNWFQERVIPNTVALTKDDYLSALISSLKVVILAEPARTDFGGSRQREFGQQWTDFARGYLGEIALKKYFQKCFGIQAELEQRETGQGIEKYLPTDVVRIKKNGRWQKVRKTLSIKTSKLGSMWLGFSEGRLRYSDAFAFVKIGIPLNHLATFMKEIGILDSLFKYAVEKKILNDSEARTIREKIPSFKPIPAYFPGFAWKKDFKNGKFEHKDRKKYRLIIGGIGKLPENRDRISVEGLDDPSEDYLGACGTLRWNKKDWNSLISAM